MRSYNLRHIILFATLLCTLLAGCQSDTTTGEPNDGVGTCQNPDSLAFVTAPRTEFSAYNATGYTISTRIFDAPQTISVIRFSPADFSLKPILSQEVTKVSDTAKRHNADYAINACYWAVSTGKATTMIKSDGVVLSTTYSSWYPRVNGLLYMYYNKIEIVQSYDYPDYKGLIEDCDNVIACGPVLLDDGERISYDHVTESEEESMQSKIPFFIERHPRSVIGRDAKGNVYLVVVDGRAEGNAEGMTIAELTKVCAWLGMSEAMNLDGGGSSTLWSREQGVINHPCDNKKFDHEGERKVLSTIIVKRK